VIFYCIYLKQGAMRFKRKIIQPPDIPVECGMISFVFISCSSQSQGSFETIKHTFLNSPMTWSWQYFCAPPTDPCMHDKTTPFCTNKESVLWPFIVISLLVFFCFCFCLCFFFFFHQLYCYKQFATSFVMIKCWLSSAVTCSFAVCHCFDLAVTDAPAWAYDWKL